MSLLLASAWVMIFFCGLWAGGILIFAVERTNLWRRMPIEQFAVDFRRSVLRVDPMMPILGVMSGIGAIYFALHRQGVSQLLTLAGLALLILVIAGSILIAEPMNSKFRRLPEGQIPDNVELLRARWRHFHFVRNLMAITCFAAMTAAAIF